MAKLGDLLAVDPTLAAADRALEIKEAKNKPRPYLGMSQIGEDCWRRAWNRFRFVKQEQFDSLTLKRFEDGHRTEALIIERLKLVEGITLKDIDEKTGRQIGFVDCDGHFRGHADGSIIGILQAPKALHVFEVKCVSEKKFAELKKIKADLGEKLALRKWNQVYYDQGMLYCDYMDATRHYTVVATPGGRDWMSVRTDADPARALFLKSKAKKIIYAYEPPDKVSEKPDWFECKRCVFRDVCHEGEQPDRNCRTCVHATPIENGEWHCDRLGKKLTLDEQIDGCVLHKYLPKLVPGEVVDANEFGITYKLRDGTEWYDGEVNNAKA